MANWIVVGSPENFEIARGRGFDMFGFKSTRRRESAEMKPGDKLIFYLTGVMKFGGVANVESEVYEDRTPVFRLAVHHTGTEAELEPPVGDVIQRRRHLRQERRMAIAVAHHQRAEADP